MKKEKYVQVCPKCKSIDIMRDNTVKFEGAVGLPSMFICNNCSHSSYVFPEVAVSELEDFKGKVEEKKLINTKKDNSKLVDTNYGDFIVNFFWKIIGPLVLIFGIAISFQNILGGLLPIVASLFVIYIAYFKKGKKGK